MKIHWKGRKERFAEKHSKELTEWNQADEFIKEKLPDQKFNQDDLTKELSSLKARLSELNEKLAPYKEEIDQLQIVRYFTGELIPELRGKAYKVTPAMLNDRRESLNEEYSLEIKKAKAELTKTRKANAKNVVKARSKQKEKTSARSDKRSRSGRDER